MKNAQQRICQNSCREAEKEREIVVFIRAFIILYAISFKSYIIMQKWYLIFLKYLTYFSTVFSFNKNKVNFKEHYDQPQSLEKQLLLYNNSFFTQQLILVLFLLSKPSKQFFLISYFFQKDDSSWWLKVIQLVVAFTASRYLQSAWLSSRDWNCKQLSSFSLFVVCP